jgi:hypothetical protein
MLYRDVALLIHRCCVGFFCSVHLVVAILFFVAVVIVVVVVAMVFKFMNTAHMRS